MVVFSRCVHSESLCYRGDTDPPPLARRLSRNNNWIVDTLLRVNENDRYKQFETLSLDDQKRQDEDLFQTARLVNCGWFLQVIVRDYIRSVQALSLWRKVTA